MSNLLGDRILVVGAHPDDIEMNAGGTLHRLAKKGAFISAFILSYWNRNNNSMEVRLKESRLALRVLGIGGEIYVSCGIDTRLNSQLPELITDLENVVNEVKPTTVITHFHHDSHQDHCAAYEITMAAARNVENILLFKPTFPSGRTDIPFHPNFVSHLSEIDMVAKMEAMKAFKSQHEKYGEELWLNSLKATAAGDAWTYGGFHGYAELFQVSRLIG